MRVEINLEIGDKLGVPLIKILIDDYTALYEGPAHEVIVREFDLAPGEHELKIVHYGKTDQDHVYSPDGSIAIDKYVYIKAITIDGIKLTDKELQSGQFWPVYSHAYVETMIKENQDLPSYISPNLYLGHNGTWKYIFFDPFVDWIISCRRPGPNLDNTIFKTSQRQLDEAKNFFKDLPDV